MWAERKPTLSLEQVRALEFGFPSLWCGRQFRPAGRGYQGAGSRFLIR